MKYYILAALFAFTLSGCGNPHSKEENKRKDQSGSQTKGKFHSVDKATFLLSSPLESAPKVIDSLNSSPIHNEYCLLDTIYKLSVIETKDKWSKVKVITPEWLARTYIGWIQTRDLNEFHERNSKPSKSELIRSSKPLIKTQMNESDILKEKISNGIRDVNNGDDISKVDLTSLQGINIALSIFKIYATIVNDGNASSDKDILKLTNQLKSKCTASQIKYFPKIRRAYYQLTKDKLWEHDIAVGGNGNSILKFTGGYFAANANIKETQDALHEMLTTLRFKQTQYRWYKSQDEYTYYTIKSNSDSKLMN